MTRESFSLFKTVSAIFLVFLCLWAAQWQYQRGVDRHARNEVIENQSQARPISLDAVVNNLVGNEWRTVSTRGQFSSENQILIRNRYSEGRYGFEQLTLFSDLKGRNFWVDRGWIEAGASATTAPDLYPTPTGVVKISGRLRLDSSLPRGSFFALGTRNALIPQWNAQKGVDTEGFYIDLLSGSSPELTPAVSAQLPELSDGPHMAYALQWIFFAGLVIYGRFLIRRSA